MNIRTTRYVALFSGLFLALSLVGPRAQSQQAPLPVLKHRIAVIGHRGGSGMGPENTLAAFQKAIEVGADYIEIDVRPTRDGQLILLHDSKVDRTCNGKGSVSDMDFEAVRQLDAGKKFNAQYAGEKIPTLDEALSLCKDKINIYLDHKDGPIPEIVACIRKHGMEKQVVVYDGVGECQEWKKVAPEIPVMPGLPDEYKKPGGVAEFKKILAAEILDGSCTDWSEDLVAQAHAAGSKVYVDCLSILDNPGTYQRALDMGVDGIQTDHPDKLIQFLNEPARPTNK